ncbi:MAG: HAD family hydrolase [Chloroflexota bacterium]
MIEAITFDFWDTIAADDSDESKRLALGLPSKAETRSQLFVQHVTTRYPSISAEEAMSAYGWANERFRQEWHRNHRTPGVMTRLSYAYERLGLSPRPGQYGQLVREIGDLVHEIESMEVRIPPDFAPSIHNTLQILSDSYKLGIISDTIHTHGRGLRHLLNSQGLLQYFSVFIFSDEVGASKPAPEVFRQAALQLGVSPRAIAHIGDRESNDVVGPISLGMRAVLFTGIVDRGSHKTRAHAICRHFRELPVLVQTLR